jgi:hypothetical protein
MAIPELVRRNAERRLKALCEGRVPAHLRDQVRLEYGIRGDVITLVERRPPWRPDFGSEWTSMKIAQLKYESASGAWSLWWADRNGRWGRYSSVDATADIDVLIREIDADPTCIFWG